MKKKSQGARWSAAALAGVVTVLALGLRLVRLGESPAWDGDEGYNVEIAWQLWHGHARLFALSYAYVQHPVLGYALLAPLLGLLGRELWVARLVSAVATSLAAGLITATASVAAGRRCGLLAGLALAATHFAVAYGRFAYTYNLLLLWSALVLALVLAYDRTGSRRWLWAASAAAALGLLIDQEGVALPCFVAAAALPRRRWAAMLLATGITPAALAALLMLAFRPDALADWQVSFGRVVLAADEANPWRAMALALARWFVNYFHLLRAEWWWPAAVAGLFLIRPRAVQRRVLLLAGLLALPIFAVRELSPFFRTGLPLLVPAAWGVGALLDRGIDAAYGVAPRSGRVSIKDGEGIPKVGVSPSRASNTNLLGALLTALIVLLPLGLELGRSAGALATGFSLPIEWALVADQSHARQAADVVNARAAPDDVVIVSPHVAWLYQAQAVDLFQAIAYSGEAIAFYPAHLPHSRFRFDPSPAHARYAVVDGFWRRWAAEVTSVAQLLNSVSAWPLEWEGGEYRVYRRPGA